MTKIEPIYQLEHATFRYPKSDRDTLSNVSLELAPGQILSILGPNGAGKSTLLSCMVGLLRPQGIIRLFGKPLDELSRAEIARGVAYVQQIHVPAFSYTVFQFVLMGRAPHVAFFGRPRKEDEEIVWEALDEIGITHLAAKPYTELSGGERQQCVIARALAQRPRVILFDEPVAHLDFGNQVRVLRLIKRMAETGYAVVMTTHNPDHVLLLGGQAAILDQKGSLRSGKADDVLTEESMQALYGTDIKLVHVDAIGRPAVLYREL